MKKNVFGFCLVSGLAAASFSLAMVSTNVCLAQPDPAWKIHDMSRPQPPVIDPGTPSTQEQAGKPPSDATVLFDGKDVSQWASMDGNPAKWIVKDGYMESVKGSGYVRTLENFGDCQLHVEWAAPAPASGSGQGRGNSGVFLMGVYEVQVLDSYQNQTYADGQAGAVYCQYPPLANASLPPGKWQTYDIIFMRPQFDSQGKPITPARLTLFHNGVLVQNNVELSGPTGWLRRDQYWAHSDKLPVSLQDHGNPVRFRNIWVRELSDDGQKEFTFSNELLDRYAGVYEADPGFKINIFRRDNQLMAGINETAPDRAFLLFAESKTMFFTKTVDAKVEFVTDAQGNPQGLIFHIGGDQRKAKKTK